MERDSIYAYGGSSASINQGNGYDPAIVNWKKALTPDNPLKIVSSKNIFIYVGRMNDKYIFF